MSASINKKIMRTSLTGRLERYDDLSDADKKKVSDSLFTSVGHLFDGMIASFEDPKVTVKRGYGMPHAQDILLITAKGQTPGVDKKAWNKRMTLWKWYGKLIDALRKGADPEPKENFQGFYKHSLGDADWRICLTMSRMVDWIMLPYYHYCWLEWVRKRAIAVRRGATLAVPLTEDDLLAATDAIAYFRSDHYKVIRAQLLGESKIATRNRFGTVHAYTNPRTGNGYPDAFANQRKFYTPIGGVAKSRLWSDPLVIAAMDAMPLLHLPNPFAESLEKTSLKKFSWKDLPRMFGRDSTSLHNALKVEKFIATIMRKSGDSLPAILQERMVQEAGKRVNVDATMHAEAAGIDLEELAKPVDELIPWYQRPSFTLAAAGGIFALGYAIIKNKR